MVQIIEEQRKPTFKDQLMSGLAQGSQVAATEVPRFFGEKLMQAERQKRQALEDEQIGQLIGQDIRGIQDPKLRQIIVQNQLKSQGANAGKTASFQSALSTINRMREIGSRGRLGKTLTRGIFGGEQAKERGEYEQLGKSLIQYATSIPIRNRIEFETLAEKLYDPSIRDKEREGILNAMERIVSNSLQEAGGFQPTPQERKPTERPPLSSFHR